MRICVLFFALAFFICTPRGQAQQVLEGLLVEEKTSRPVPYANIGIPNTPVGTISNGDGTFHLEIPAKYKSDTVLFSALGFERVSFAISGFGRNENLRITLREQATMLKHVTVTSAKQKAVRAADLGQRFSNVGSIYLDSMAAGSAMALLIENKPPSYFPDLVTPYYISRAKLRISYNNLDLFKIRIRFLSVDSSTGLPAKDLLDESIVMSSRMRKGWLNFDLEKYRVRIHQPRFFVVFEWILEDEDRTVLLDQYREFRRLYPKSVSTDTLIVDGEPVYFNRYNGFRAGTSFGSSSSRSVVESHKTYYRNNSYGKWRRSSFALAAVVRVKNYQ